MNELSLHVTDVCNQRCCFCLFDDLTHEQERISREALTGFLVANRGKDFQRVNLHGGEPTIRRDLLGILEQIRALGYPDVSLQTNGVRLADPSYAEKLVCAGVSLFVVSFHGADEATHDPLVGVPGALRRVVKGIENVLALGSRVRTNTVLTRHNFSSLPATAERLVALGVQHINISSLMPQGKALASFGDLMPRYAQVVPFVEQALLIADANGVRATLEGFPLCVLPSRHRERTVLRLAAAGDIIKCLVRGRTIESHDEYAIEHCRCRGPQCLECDDVKRCPGVYRAYAEAMGWEEFRPTLRFVEACQ
jgi:MoaA/NifB/PqqE/SkfB family radical SAM enzyme